MTIFLPPLDLAQPNLFPPIATALDEPDGLLAIGGDLSCARLIAAYSQGIFPWFSQQDPYLWWSPSERAIIKPAQFNPSRSLRKTARQQTYRVSINQAFEQVIAQCALIRGEQQVWITAEMRAAYIALHKQGAAHSVETWQGDNLIGGFYGVSVGQLFCGESMFSLATGGSKTALWHFCHHFNQLGGKLIDCQMMTPHLASLGASAISRPAYLTLLNQLKHQPVHPHCFEPQWISL